MKALWPAILNVVTDFADSFSITYIPWLILGHFPVTNLSLSKRGQVLNFCGRNEVYLRGKKKNHLYILIGFTLSLALKQRLETIPKWPTVSHISKGVTVFIRLTALGAY